MRDFSLYVHIPFCASKCNYCDFFSLPVTSVPDSYIACLVKEANFYAEKYGVSRWRTIYVGGGTPSLLSAMQLEHLILSLRSVCLDSSCIAPDEITVEMNPESVFVDKIEACKRSGVTRISLGVQSLSSASLCAVNRHCNAPKALSALSLLKEKWQGDLSVDMIAGLPLQDDIAFEEGLNRILSFSPNHISLYTLTIEEGTPLAKQITCGKVFFDSDRADSQWLCGKKNLEDAGFEWYEVSNFCRDGKLSLHNFSYWEQRDYIGVGSGATGTVYGQKTLRWTNTRDITRYIDFWLKDGKVLDKDLPCETEDIELDTREFEFLMLGLRTKYGINSREYSKRFSSLEPWRGSLEKRLFPIAHFGLKSNFEKDGSTSFSLTDEARLFLNRILIEL